MGIKVKDVQLRVLNMWTRMPFRYGITTLKALPHLFVRVTTEIDGKTFPGVSADGLAPKWFTKDPNSPVERDVLEMLAVVRAASTYALQADAVPTPFHLWQRVYDAQQNWGSRNRHPALLWHFGVSLIERAVIDAFCHAAGKPFTQVLHDGSLGLDLGAIHSELQERSTSSLLPSAPRRQITIRHTVGMADPLTENQIASDQRAEDGLPQSLDACIREYGLTHFKIKLPSHIGEAADRLTAIARIVQNECSSFAFTIDGNELFHEVKPFRELWNRLRENEAIDTFFRQGLLFVEQPWHRDVALSDAVAEAMQSWTDRPPIIIDESDGEIGSLPRALECGYAGTSHKNCKGVFKGLANACLIEHRRKQDSSTDYRFSGEDLANVGPVALLQDLAVTAALGLEHVERNGHHYFAGLSAMPPRIQEQVLQYHGDLYHSHSGRKGSFPTLTIRNGEVRLDSVVKAPFGYGVDLDFTQFTPVEKWRFESLTTRR